MVSVALVTCVELPEPDHDEELLLSSLRQAGMHSELLAWDDPQGNPGEFDLCVLRSCWNYYENPEAFLSWIVAAETSSRLANPPNIIRWNLHKRYLQKLQDAGVPIIPTEWFNHGETVDLFATMRARSWDDIVVKPAVSASSFRTKRFRIDQVREGQVFLEALLRERDAMVQRYVPTSESRGERALVWIDRELTHAVTKSPRFAGGVEQVSDALPVSDQDMAIANQALSCVDGELLYARVDVVNDNDGKLLVSELELMEPSLFLLQCPAALERFVNAIGRMCSFDK
jgi:glutathione synthase/RimK-type ligase-like ATP-grasp enzyme